MTMEMGQGYPSETDIESELGAIGIEIPDEYAAPYISQFKDFVWGLVNAARWAMSLSVYPASATTFNVRGGKYIFKGTVKTYTAASAIDPTDDDTTYVWMEDDNTIGYEVDGTGWPSTEHIKLAEIDVDSDGNITEVRDLRGQTFLNYGAGDAVTIEAHTANDTLTVQESGSVHTNLGASGAITLTLPSSAPVGTKFTFAVQAAQELRIDPGTATIRDDSGQTADKYKSADAIGECITLVADGNGDWVTIAKNGTWTEEA